MAQDVKHSWPQNRDRLFPKKERSSQTGACLGDSWFADPDWDYLYREGWYEQASLTAQHLMDESRSIRPFPGLLLPMLYSYRHYLELSLKAIILDYSAIAGMPCPQIAEESHGLMPLWNKAKPLLKRQFPSSSDPAPRIVETCLNDFHAIDSSSQTFRYAKNRNGKSTSDFLPQVNVAQLCRTMENLHSFFEGCSMWVDEALSSKAEMEAEHWNCH